MRGARSVYYRRAIGFIACNDEPGDLDMESIIGYISVVLVSEAFGVPVETVATQVWECRMFSKSLGPVKTNDPFNLP